MREWEKVQGVLRQREKVKKEPAATTVGKILSKNVASWGRNNVERLLLHFRNLTIAKVLLFCYNAPARRLLNKTIIRCLEKLHAANF